MKSLLLLSPVLLSILIPALTARDPNPRRGLRRTVVWLFVVIAAYLFYLTSLHPVLFVPHWPG